MATKTSKLHTSFTGDDKQFQRTAGRVMKSGTQMGAMAGRLKGAFAAMGGAMVISGIIDKFDRIGKLATRFDVTAETLQKLGHVAQIGGADLETVAKAMKTLNTSAADAKEGMATYVREFDTLGIKVDDFFKLNHEQRWLAIADAVKNATDRNAAMAAITKLMGRAGAEVFTILEQGGAATREMMESITVAKDETVKAIEEINDKMTELATVSGGTFANIFVGVIDGVMAVGKAIAMTVGMAKAMLPGGQTPEEFRIAWQATGQAESDRRAKESDAKDAAKKAKEKVGEAGIKAEAIKEREALLLTTPIFANKIKRAFAEDENPFAETIAALEEKWKPDELAKKKEEAEQRNLSGQFSEFMQTAGLGGTGYLRKTPEIVQLEKQTKISESMLQSINDFNSSMGILVENTVDR
tara:strand:+ start:981 stop:2216 length:1236 start_codon:yes stop_codon:yes gene_type:complete